MGLDSGFEVHSKSCPEFKLEVAYFRKYYELDTWCRDHCTKINEYEFLVTGAELEALKKIIEPIVSVLRPLGDDVIDAFDRGDHPIKINTYNNLFDPSTSSSAFPGWKVCRLYEGINSMLDILELNFDIFITYYSSW